MKNALRNSIIIFLTLGSPVLSRANPPGKSDDHDTSVKPVSKFDVTHDLVVDDGEGNRTIYSVSDKPQLIALDPEISKVWICVYQPEIDIRGTMSSSLIACKFNDKKPGMNQGVLAGVDCSRSVASADKTNFAITVRSKAAIFTLTCASTAPTPHTNL